MTLKQNELTIQSIYAKFHLWKRSSTLLCNQLQNCRNFSIFALRQRSEPVKIHSSYQMSSLATMLPSMSIQKEAVGGRSDGSTTHGALAKLLATMTISANRMATWHQNHSRPMLLTNRTGGTGASTGLGRGHFAIGIFRAPSHCNFEMPAIFNDLSLWKAQFQQKFQQWLFQHVHTVFAIQYVFG